MECLDEPEPESSHATPDLRILLLEDVELNITVATALLEKLGHSVTPARCGAEALELVKPGRFDLLLLDIQLPDMTGFEVADQLLERYGTEGLPPMVALTANLIRDKSEYLAHGMTDAIGKPLSVDNLKRVLSQLFATPESTQLAVPPPEESVEVLDMGFLIDYADMVGKEVLVGAVELFEQMMPQYLNELDARLEIQDREGVTSEAHKIKSAAGAIGLKRLHQLAKLAQSAELAEWEAKIGDWIAELHRHYPQDLAALKRWLGGDAEATGG